jgi:hypothetical protein
MVRFNKITVIQNNREFDFDHLAVFNEFRLEIFHRTLQPEKQLLLDTFNNHKRLEGMLENRFHKPEGQFEGLCLAFGTTKAVDKFISNKRLRKIFEHWDTNVELTINLDTQNSVTNIQCEGNRSSYEFNSRLTLIPLNVNIESSYNTVATRRQFSWPPRTNIY